MSKALNNINIYDVRVHPGDSAYLIDDGETAILYDSGFGFTGRHIADNIADILKDRQLDYIFLTHSHYDHALASIAVCDKYPNVTVVASKHAANVFTRPGAKAVMKRLDKKVAEAYGVTEYDLDTDKLRTDIAVEDGDTVKAGGISFLALHLPGHTNCSMGYYCEEKRLLLSCESLGVFDGKDMIIPSVLTGYNAAINSIKRVCELNPEFILAPHIGLLSKESTAYFLSHMQKATETAAEFIANKIRAGISDEEIRKEYIRVFCSDFSKEAYPEDAANLNTSIMIELIRKEFNL